MQEESIGVGPHPKPWPSSDIYDPQLLAEGDSRNVEDKYRYMSVQAIVDDLDKTRSGLHIAIENWQNDSNIGTIVRSANAFNVSAVHIIGRRHWNRRGAMVTDRYLHIFHHSTIDDFVSSIGDRKIIAIDNIAGSSPLSSAKLPQQAVLVFGAEGPGISQDLLAIAGQLIMIEQYGSTRSLNVGVASGIVMYHWTKQYMI